MKTIKPSSSRRSTNGAGDKNNGHDTPEGKQLQVSIPKLEVVSVRLRLVSETPLIVHEFSEKARKMMLDKQTGKASRGREKKDPLVDFKSSLYTRPGFDKVLVQQGGKVQFPFGFPARGFKACAIKASNDIELVKTEMKRAVRVTGPDGNDSDVDALVPIEAPPLAPTSFTKWDTENAKDLELYHALGISMREDVVRLATGVADLRFRACFPRWSCIITVKHNKRMVSTEQVIALFNAAGFGVGIGEWRPGAPQSESGQFGCFHVQPAEDEFKW